MTRKWSAQLPLGLQPTFTQRWADTTGSKAPPAHLQHRCFSFFPSYGLALSAGSRAGLTGSFWAGERGTSVKLMLAQIQDWHSVLGIFPCSFHDLKIRNIVPIFLPTKWSKVFMERQWATGFLKCQLLPKCPQKLVGSVQAHAPKTWLLPGFRTGIWDIRNANSIFHTWANCDFPISPHKNWPVTGGECEQLWDAVAKDSATSFCGNNLHKMYFKYIFTISWLPNYSHAK